MIALSIRIHFLKNKVCLSVCLSVTALDLSYERTGNLDGNI